MINPLKNKTAQNIVEYTILIAALIGVIVFALRPNGFVTTSLNQSFNETAKFIQRIADCTCYDSEGKPCVAKCGDDCCNGDEDEVSCPIDCGGPGYYWGPPIFISCSGYCSPSVSTFDYKCFWEKDGSVVADHFCEDNMLPKPPLHGVCGEDCHYNWLQHGDWNGCTVNCGTGTQYQTVQCQRSPDNAIVGNAFCAPPENAKTYDQVRTSTCSRPKCCTCGYENYCGGSLCCNFGTCGQFQHSRRWACDVPCSCPDGTNNCKSGADQCTNNNCCRPFTNGGCGAGASPACPDGQRRYNPPGAACGAAYCQVDASCNFSCTGGQVNYRNNGYCSGDTTGLTANTSTTYVNSCGTAKCQIICKSPFIASGGTCACPASCPIDDGSTCLKTVTATKTFAAPLVSGRAIEYCSQGAANAFCVLNGYSSASSFGSTGAEVGTPAASGCEIWWDGGSSFYGGNCDGYGFWYCINVVCGKSATEACS